jgi:hypothetical protein
MEDRSLTNRHGWTFTTRRRYGPTYYLPTCTVLDHGIYVYSRRPMNEQTARACAALFLPDDARITSARAGRHQITTRHQVGKPSHAHEYTGGYVQSVAR